jgi:hypothetical protein
VIGFLVRGLGSVDLMYRVVTLVGAYKWLKLDESYSGRMATYKSPLG